MQQASILILTGRRNLGIWLSAGESEGSWSEAPFFLQCKVIWTSSWQSGSKKERRISNVLFLTGLHCCFPKHTLPTQGMSWALVAIICLCMYFYASLPYYLSLSPLLSDNEFPLIDCMPMTTASHLSANRQLCSISITCHYDAATVLQPFPVLWSAKINYPRLNY